MQPNICLRGVVKKKERSGKKKGLPAGIPQSQKRQLLGNVRAIYAGCPQAVLAPEKAPYINIRYSHPVMRRPAGLFSNSAKRARGDIKIKKIIKPLIVMSFPAQNTLRRQLCVLCEHLFAFLYYSMLLPNVNLFSAFFRHFSFLNYQALFFVDCLYQFWYNNRESYP